MELRKKEEIMKDVQENYIDYVVGFLIDKARRLVVLIEKQRPDWQIGKLNGVGGHINADEAPIDAMEREFKEETGLAMIGWKHAITMASRSERIFFFYADWEGGEVRTTTDEKIIIANYSQLPRNTLLSARWAIAICRDWNIARPLEIEFANRLFPKGAV